MVIVVKWGWLRQFPAAILPEVPNSEVVGSLPVLLFAKLARDIPNCASLKSPGGVGDGVDKATQWQHSCMSWMLLGAGASGGYGMGVCPPEHNVVVVDGMGLDGTAAAGLAITCSP